MLSDQSRLLQSSGSKAQVSPADHPRNFLSSESTNLDLLRAIAVLLVYFSHLFGSLLGFVGSGLYAHDKIGRVGVMFFFVHTFLVLMMSLERMSARGTSLVSQFYIRRAFRIYPLSILTVCTVAAFHIPAMPTL